MQKLLIIVRKSSIITVKKCAVYSRNDSQRRAPSGDMPFEVRFDAVGTVLQRGVHDLDAPYRKVPHIRCLRLYANPTEPGRGVSHRSASAALDALCADGTYSGGQTEDRYEILRNALYQTRYR